NITMDTVPYSAVNVQAIAQKMSDKEIYLVGELSGKVVGWGVIKRYSDRAGYAVCCETSIYFTEKETGKGYGKMLQTALMQRVRAFGYHHVVAKILAANASSIRFHERFGFETVGVQKEIGFLNGQWHDVVIMQCILS
ncbi:MAG: N-acetyltransferase family protein, partial [Cyanobacteria bacterium J06649_4]